MTRWERDEWSAFAKATGALEGWAAEVTLRRGEAVLVSSYGVLSVLIDQQWAVDIAVRATAPARQREEDLNHIVVGRSELGSRFSLGWDDFRWAEQRDHDQGLLWEVGMLGRPEWRLTLFMRR